MMPINFLNGMTGWSFFWNWIAVPPIKMFAVIVLASLLSLAWGGLYFSKWMTGKAFWHYSHLPTEVSTSRERKNERRLWAWIVSGMTWIGIGKTFAVIYYPLMVLSAFSGSNLGWMPFLIIALLFALGISIMTSTSDVFWTHPGNASEKLIFSLIQAGYRLGGMVIFSVLFYGYFVFFFTL